MFGRPFESTIVRNQLLRALPAASLSQLEAGLTGVPLRLGDLLASQGWPVERLYFINHGLASVPMAMRDAP